MVCGVSRLTAWTLGAMAVSVRLAVPLACPQALGMSPYEGSVFHAPPLVLQLLGPLRASGLVTPELFLLGVDLLVALLVYRIARVFVFVSHPVSASVAQADKPVDESEGTARLCALLFLVHPFTATAGAVGSWSSLEALALALALHGAACRNAAVAALGLAGGIYMALFPALLALPIALVLYGGLDTAPNATVVSRPGTVVVFWVHLLLWLAGFVALSEALMRRRGSEAWAWVLESYMCTLTVEELTPNLGLYWYFFIELFDVFRPFYLGALFAQPLLLTAPLTIRFGHRPLFGALICVVANSIFYPYPSVAHVGFYHSLMPMFSSQLHLISTRLPVGVGFLVGVVLGPIFWHLWIYTGVANSNFYYSITLVNGATQGMLLVACLTSTSEYDRQRRKLAPPRLGIQRGFEGEQAYSKLA